MGEIGDTMLLGMQAGITSRRGERTLLDFLRERMDGGAAHAERKRSFKERFGLNGFACCGAHWGLGPTVLDDNNERGPLQQVPFLTPALTVTFPGEPCSGDSPAAVEADGMNLAAALEAERQLRAAEESEGGVSPSPLGHESTSGPDIGPAQNRMSLMRLLHETEREELEREEGEEEGCCVCMRRKKGAAFIPCGHTFCRVCSRELWLNRGSCPLCNRPILEILDIF